MCGMVRPERQFALERRFALEHRRALDRFVKDGGRPGRSQGTAQILAKMHARELAVFQDKFQTICHLTVPASVFHSDAS